VAGVEALAAFAKSIGVAIAPKNLPLEPGVSVALDGYGETGERVVIVEVSAQVGKAKPAQVKKVLGDVLKLAIVKRSSSATASRSTRASYS
jgi:hypothetical protein